MSHKRQFRPQPPVTMARLSVQIDAAGLTSRRGGIGTQMAWLATDTTSLLKFLFLSLLMIVAGWLSSRGRQRSLRLKAVRGRRARKKVNTALATEGSSPLRVGKTACTIPICRLHSGSAGRSVPASSSRPPRTVCEAEMRWPSPGKHSGPSTRRSHGKTSRGERSNASRPRRARFRSSPRLTFVSPAPNPNV